MKYFFFILPIFLGISLFTSCDKEDIDITEIEDNFTPEVVECDNFYLPDSLTVYNQMEISFDSLNGTPPYTYLWSTGETSPTIIAFESEGLITVTITDANGCIAMSYIGIYHSCEDIMPQLIHDPIGIYTVWVGGGASPFTYEWSNGETSQSIKVEDGPYSLTVTDAIGSTCAQNFTVNLPDSCTNFVIGISPSNSPNSIALDVSGGSGNYGYKWSNGDISNPITNLNSDGQYSVTVTDLESGCLRILTIFSAFSDNCSDFALKLVETSPGTLDLITCGGEAPYSYTWSSGETSEVLTNLASGLYIITVVDNAGCLAFLSYVVDLQEECDDLTTEIVESIPGKVFAITNGGVPPYRYKWNTSGYNAAFEIIPPISINGIYSVTITDSNDCTTTDIIEL